MERWKWIISSIQAQYRNFNIVKWFSMKSNSIVVFFIIAKSKRWWCKPLIKFTYCSWLENKKQKKKFEWNDNKMGNDLFFVDPLNLVMFENSSFQTTVEKPKPKQLLRPITTGANSTMNQSQFLAIIWNLLKAREYHAYMVRLVLVWLLISWKTGASLLSQSLSVAIAIT